MEVADNARKHGIDDLDIDDGEPVAIHAMALRPKFYEQM